MTEDEAKTKWCPHAVASHTDPRAKSEWDEDGNSTGTKRFRHNCLGSACMAWRWWSRSYPNEPSTPAVLEARKNDEGYCGLAGRPS